MRYLPLCLLSLLALAPAYGQPPTWKDAEQRLLRGNYAEARELFELLGKEPQNKTAAAIGLCRAWQSEGGYDKALDIVDAAIKNDPESG